MATRVICQAGLISLGQWCFRALGKSLPRFTTIRSGLAYLTGEYTNCSINRFAVSALFIARYLLPESFCDCFYAWTPLIQIYDLKERQSVNRVYFLSPEFRRGNVWKSKIFKNSVHANLKYLAANFWARIRRHVLAVETYRIENLSLLKDHLNPLQCARISNFAKLEGQKSSTRLRKISKIFRELYKTTFSWNYSVRKVK